MHLIVGLGNPGPEYENTRHNIGCQTVDNWCRSLGVRLSGRSFQSKSTRLDFQGKKVLVLCPLTFMNRSGQAVRAGADYYDIDVENILVIHDDLDLPVGRLKVAMNSGAGGHKGVRSIIDHLGTTQFGRIKIGIGRPQYGEDIESYVLSPFYKAERDIVENTLHTAIAACESFISNGMISTMNKINRRTHKEDDGCDT